MSNQSARPDLQTRRAAVRRTVWIFAIIVTVIYVSVLWRGMGG